MHYLSSVGAYVCCTGSYASDAYAKGDARQCTDGLKGQVVLVLKTTKSHWVLQLHWMNYRTKYKPSNPKRPVVWMVSKMNWYNIQTTHSNWLYLNSLTCSSVLASSPIFGTKDWSPQSTKVETNLTPITTVRYASTATLGKILCIIINSRVVHFLSENNVLRKCQIGFLPNYRTTDHVFTLNTLIHKQTNQNKGKVFSCFVDLEEKAFDSIWHEGPLCISVLF